MNLNPTVNSPIAPTTIKQFRDYVRQAADVEDDPNIADLELERYINMSLTRVYDLLVLKYGEEYFASKEPYEFSTTAGTLRYDLPFGFYKLLGVDYQAGSGETGWVNIPQFQFAERNRYNYPSLAVQVGPFIDVRYRIQGKTLMFEPAPDRAYSVRVHYIPQMPQLVSSGTVKLNAVSAGTNVLTFNDLYTGLSASFLAGTDYATGSSDSDAATNLAAAVTASTLGTDLGYTASSSGSVVYIGLPEEVPTAVSVTSSDSTSFVSAWPARNLSGTFQNSFDGISGWDDLAVVDAAIKVVVKQQRDAALLSARRMQLMKEVEEAAEHRDPGEPQTATLVPDGNPWGGGFGWNGNGSFNGGW